MQARTIPQLVRFLVGALAAVVLSQQLAAEPASPTPSEATLPLPELLRLYRENDEAKRKPRVDPPPVRAALQRIDFRGRLLDSGVDLTAQFEVVVLSDGEWVGIPLMRKDAQTHLSTLPELPQAAFVVRDEQLNLITKQKGIYKFQISFLRQAERQELQRTVRLDYGAATLAACHVAFDEGLFHLTNTEVIERPDGVMLFPEGDAFTITWERTGRMETKKVEAPRPAIESVVPVAHAATISTLEGKRLTRLRYQLRFAGKKPIQLTIPQGLTVERAYLNGASIPVDIEGRVLALEVSPAREGDEAGVLELVLSSSGNGYFLSGALEVLLPRVSWPVNELFLDLHLPQVFNYSWSGGSLSPVEQSPQVHYTYKVPQPGKKLTFHQHLISSSAPNVTLDYAVDLQGHYYRP